MSLFNFFGQLMTGKVKDMIENTLNTIDLDKDGKPDKPLWLAWVASMENVFSEVDASVNQPKLMAALEEGAKTVKEVVTYLEVVEKATKDPAPEAPAK